jgi:hypothetical protein
MPRAAVQRCLAKLRVATHDAALRVGMRNRISLTAAGLAGTFVQAESGCHIGVRYGRAVATQR